MKLSLIIPVYNEAETLPFIWQRLHAVEWPLEVEYVLVDDGSTDGSREVIQSLSGPGVRIIFQPKNQGKTAALVAGIEAAQGEIIAVQDADLEYDPQDLTRVIRPILEGNADVVYGSRFKQSGDQIQRTYHRLGVKALTYFSNLCTGVYLTDLEGCYKAWRADLLKNVVVGSSGFDFDPEVTAKIAKLRLRMHEVHIAYYPRLYQEGKKIGFKDGLTAGWSLIKYSFLVPFARCFKPTLPTKYLYPSQKL
jgi:glycosyltransferase involved in cell wall biosynthesis